MLPELLEIRTRRLSLGLTQSQLSHASQVSQSLIAKIESKKTIPSYYTAKKIFESLEALEKNNLKTAKNVMTPHIDSINEDDLIETALKKMKQKKYSQLPVLRHGLPVGSISEKTLLDKLTSGITPEQLSKMPSKEAMDESFPVIEENTPLVAVSSLLAYSNAILVKRKQTLVGIITRSNLLSI